MKKMLAVLFILMSMSAFALDGHLRLGVYGNTSEYNDTEESFDNYGPSLGFEIKQSLLVFEVGAGVEYQGETDDSELAMVPAYVFARWNVFPVLLKPYIVGKVGRVLYTSEDVHGSDPEASLYYAGGIGIEFAMLEAELLYSVTEINNDHRGDDSLERISLIVGIELF